MSIDYEKNDYAKIGNFTNVVMEYRKGRVFDGVIAIHHRIDELITKVALAHPEWILVSDNPYTSPPVVCDFRIYEDGDRLGRIRLDSMYSSDPKYEIDNQRIRDKRARHGGMKTNNLKKALKIIDENMYGKTFGERVSQAQALASSTISNGKWRRQRLFNNVAEPLMPKLMAYFMDNFEKVGGELIGYGATKTQIDAVMRPYEDNQIAQSIEMTKGMTIVTYKDDYIALDKNDATAVATCKSHELSADIRGKLGILKTCDVVGDPEIIENVGMRIDTNVFFVLK